MECCGFEPRLPLQTSSGFLLKFVDLHLHTTYSDGFSSPEEVLREASKRQFSIIAITDHDTVKGSEEAERIADKFGIEIIPGVEITTSAGPREFHILGYFFDRNNEALLKGLQFNRNQRFERMKRIVIKLNALGLNFKFEELWKFAGNGEVLGRLHIAHFLFEKKMVGSPKEAFEKYIGQKKPGYEKGEYISTMEAIKLIKDAGGIAVWAHPGQESFGGTFSQLLNWGLQGLEVYHPNHSESEISHLNYLSQKYGLYVTGGSDCHGKGKDRILIGEIKLSIDQLELLREAVQRCV